MDRQLAFLDAALDSQTIQGSRQVYLYIRLLQIRKGLLLGVESPDDFPHHSSLCGVRTDSLLLRIHWVDFGISFSANGLSQPALELGVDQGRAAFVAYNG